MLYKEYSRKKKKLKNKKLQNEVICYRNKVETFPLKVCTEKKNEDVDEHRLLQLYHADCTLDVLVEHSFLKSNTWEFPNKCKSKEKLDVKYKSSKIHLRDEASESEDEPIILSSKKSKRQVKGLKKKMKTVEVLSSEEVAEFYRHLFIERKSRFERIIEKYENYGESEIINFDNLKINTASGKWRRLRENDLNPAPYVYNEKTTAYLKMIWERSCSPRKGKTNIKISFTKETRKHWNFLYNSNEANEPILSKDFTPEKYSNSHFKARTWLKNPSPFDISLYEHSPQSTSSSDIEFDETLPCHSVRASHISSPQHFNLKTTDLNERKYPKGSNNQSFAKKSTLSTQRYSSKEVRNWSEDDLSKSPQQSISPRSVQTFRSKSGGQVLLRSFSPSSGRSVKDKMRPQYDSDESSFLEDQNNSYGKESVSNKTPVKSRKSKNELAYQISKDVCHYSVTTVTTEQFDNFADFKVQKNSYKLFDLSRNRTDSKNKVSISNEDVENNPLNVPRPNRKVRNMPKDKNHTKKNILEKETLSEKSSSKSKFETFMPYCNLLESKSHSLQSVRSKICKSTDDSIETQDVSDNLSKETNVFASETNSLKPFKGSFPSPLYSKFKESYLKLGRLPVNDLIKYNYETVCNGSDKPLISSKCESLAAKDLKSFNESSQTTENHLTDNSPNSLTSFIALNSSSKNSCSLKHHSPKNKTCKTDDSNERQNKKRKIGSSEFVVVRKSKRINANKPTLQQPVCQRNVSKAKKLLVKEHFKHSGLSQELILSEQRSFSKDSKDVKSVDSPSDKHLETLTPCPNNYDNLKNKVSLAKYSKCYNLKDVSIRLEKLVRCQISSTENFEHVLADSNTTMLPKEFGSFTDKYKALPEVQKCFDKPLDVPRYRLRSNSIKTPPFLNSAPKIISSIHKKSKQIKCFLQDNKMEFKPEENSVGLTSSSWPTGQKILAKKQINKKDKIDDFHRKKFIASDFGGASGHLPIDVLSSPLFNKINYRF